MKTKILIIAVTAIVVGTVSFFSFSDFGSNAQAGVGCGMSSSSVASAGGCCPTE